MFEKINAIITRIKQQQPLILNITNDVTMDFIANGLLSLGASPVMSQAKQEVEELVALAKSAVINPGTLNEEFVVLMQQVCAAANKLHKPIILDPVGAGASRYRTITCQQLLNDFSIAIVRGNASEIMALAGNDQVTRGVDSAEKSQSAVESAKVLSQRYAVVIVISGEVDFIIENDVVHQCDRGSAMMPVTTGTGCLFSAVVGAFHAVYENRFEAACAAAHFYGVCGEIAANKAQGPGSFKVEFLNALNLSPQRENYEKN